MRKLANIIYFVGLIIIIAIMMAPILMIHYFPDDLKDLKFTFLSGIAIIVFWMVMIRGASRK